MVPSSDGTPHVSPSNSVGNTARHTRPTALQALPFARADGDFVPGCQRSREIPYLVIV